MFAEASTIHPHSDPGTKSVSCIRVPNYSSRIVLVECKEKSVLGTHSQRVVSTRVKKNILDILERAGRKLLLLYVKVKFLFWYNLINRDWVQKKSWYLRYYPKLISDGVTPLWAHRKGLQIVVPYYVEIYRKQTRRAMRRWKMYVYEIRLLIIRMFNKWLVKASRWKLNRLNAMRFLQLTSPWGLKIKRSLRKYWWPIFRYQCDLVLIRRLVRLLFRCWRTVTMAMIRGRRLVKHRTLVLLWENRADERNRQEAMRIKCEAIAAHHLTKRAWQNWQLARHRRSLIKRTLWTYCDGLLRSAWRSWAYDMHDLPISPRKPSSPRRVLPTPPLPVEKPGYKRRGSRLPRVPPHIVVPLMGLHSYALVHTPGTTAKDRMEFRIHRAERIAEKFEHHLQEHKAAHPGLALENTPVNNSKLGGSMRAWSDVTVSHSKTHSGGIVSSSPIKPAKATSSNVHSAGNVRSAIKSHVLKTPGRSASPQYVKSTPSRPASSIYGGISGGGGGISGGGTGSSNKHSRPPSVPRSTPSSQHNKPPLCARKKLL